MRIIRQSLGKGNMPPINASSSGFTLLELLIAMSLLVLIVAITMGALRLASRSVTAGERTAENQERFRTVLGILDAQIQSQLPLTVEENVNRAYYFQGDNKTMRLATNYSIWGGGRGYVFVNYRVKAEGERGKETLYAAEQSPGIEGTRETRLFTNASEISFEYYDKKPGEKAGNWLEQWNDALSLPQRIKLHVAYGAKKFLFQFSLRAQGKTMLVQMKPFSKTGGAK